LRGLAHLARNRIIHRDLKPENIMFRKENAWDLAICDFGLATYAD
jgi:serine/threonine protein kinase